MKTILTAFGTGLLMMAVITGADAAICADGVRDSGCVQRDGAGIIHQSPPVAQQKVADHPNNGNNHKSKNDNKHYYGNGSQRHNTNRNSNGRHYSNNNGNRRYYSNGNRRYYGNSNRQYYGNSNRQYYYRNGVRVYR